MTRGVYKAVKRSSRTRSRSQSLNPRHTIDGPGAADAADHAAALADAVADKGAERRTAASSSVAADSAGAAAASCNTTAASAAAAADADADASVAAFSSAAASLDALDDAVATDNVCVCVSVAAPVLTGAQPPNIDAAAADAEEQAGSSVDAPSAAAWRSADFHSDTGSPPLAAARDGDEDADKQRRG